MSDALFHQLSTVQSNTQPVPPTIIAATTISPTTFLTFISGGSAIATIVPFVTGAHVLCFIFTGSPVAFATTGNIKSATLPVQNVPVFLVYDPISGLYWPGRLVSP